MLIAVDECNFGGPAQGTGETTDEIQARLLVMICLGLADDRLTQEVGRECQ